MDHEFLIEAIRGRRSVRRYKKESVPMEKLMLLVEAARWAPFRRELAAVGVLVDKR